MIIHIQTRIETVFGVLENGNVTRMIPVRLEMQRLDESSIAELLIEINKRRVQLEEQLCQVQSE